MMRKLVAISCLLGLAISMATFYGCSGPGDVVTVDPSARTLPGDGSGTVDPTKDDNGVSIDPQ